MAKRFTDTGKWDKAWFRKLQPAHKCAWIFLCDRCDHAGIWEIDEDAFAHFVGNPLSIADVVSTFGEKVMRVGESKLLITGFIEFQYGELNPENRVHKSIISKLKREGLNKDLNSPAQGAKDMDKEKELEKVKEKGESEGKRLTSSGRHAAHFGFDFQHLFDTYPRNQKKTISISLMAEKIKTPDDYVRVQTAIHAYRAHCEAQGTEFSKILTFPNWWLEWQDWLDPKTGTATIDKKVSTINWDEVTTKKQAVV